MKKRIPTFATDGEAEDFVETADLTEYDLSGARMMRFDPEPGTEIVHLSMPELLVDALRLQARRTGTTLQQVVRAALERAVEGPEG